MLDTSWTYKSKSLNGFTVVIDEVFAARVSMTEDADTRERANERRVAKERKCLIFNPSHGELGRALKSTVEESDLDEQEVKSSKQHHRL